MAYEITEQVLKDIKHHASRGLTRRQIAAAMGFSHVTLYDKIKKDPNVLNAIKEGEASGLQQVANALFLNATEHNNTTAQIFYLKNRAPEEWKDRVPEGAGAIDTPIGRIEIVTVDGRKQAD